VAKGTELGGAAHGIQAVNAEEPNSCFPASIIGIRTERLHAVDTLDGLCALGSHRRNYWAGRFWVHKRFCSAMCESLFELERAALTSQQRWLSYLGSGN
jgi:hypothetical protein